jgi:hypothetical protein
MVTQQNNGRRKRVGNGNKGSWKGGTWSLDEYFQQATLCCDTLQHYILM